ncbi:hypothetical protein [Bacillus sp. FJAT-27445]|uniref:hypothetical protein n=1 Tax=Bacillus sp. FJAT-27445 TaxID=1679166 RepID=UPI000AE01179|nr:hypothetical protein [Bacillus sp. FJAT-27445]
MNASMEEKFTLAEFHRKQAIHLFNKVWDYMEKSNRTPNEEDLMIHMAHSSRYHWGQVGTPVNHSRGEWQISRVYCVLGRSEPALFHAKRNLEIVLENGIRDFDLAYAYEALARAYKVEGNVPELEKYTHLALHSANQIIKEEDKNLLLSDLKSL